MSLANENNDSKLSLGRHMKAIFSIATIVFGITTLIPFLTYAQMSGTGNLGEHLQAGDLGIDFIGPENFNFEPIDINSPYANYNSYYHNKHGSEERIQIHDGRYRGGFQLQVQSSDYIESSDATKKIPANNLAIVTEQATSNNYAETNNEVSTFSATSGNPTPLTGSIGDNVEIEHTLPFAFVFYGEAYTKIYFCPQGYITFVQNCANSDAANIITVKDNIPKIIPYFKNITTAANGGGIYFEDHSQDPNPAKRLVRIRWKGAPAGNPREKVEFEILLYKDNHLAFEYGDMTHLSDSGSGPAIGISKGDGANYVISSLNNKEKAINLISAQASFNSGINGNETIIPGTPAILAPLNGLAENENTYTNFVNATTPLNALYASACANTQGRVGTYTVYPSYKLHIPNVTSEGTYTSTITWTIIDESLNC